MVTQLVCKQCPQTMKYACSSGRGRIYIFKSTCQCRVSKLNGGVIGWALGNLTFRDWHVGDILEGASWGGGGQCLGEGKRGEGRAGGKEGRRREGKRSKGRGGVDRGGEGKKWAEGNLNGDVAAARVYFKPTPWATLILD